MRCQINLYAVSDTAIYYDVEERNRADEPAFGKIPTGMQPQSRRRCQIQIFCRSQLRSIVVQSISKSFLFVNQTRGVESEQN